MSWAADSAFLDQVTYPSEVSDWSFQPGLLVFHLRSGRTPRSVGSMVALEVVAAVSAVAAVVETVAAGCTAAVVGLMNSGVSVAGAVNFGNEAKPKSLTGAGTATVAAAGFVALVLRRPADTATSVMTSGVEMSSRIRLEAAVSDMVLGAVDVLVAMGLQCPADNVGLAVAATTADDAGSADADAAAGD